MKKLAIFALLTFGVVTFAGACSSTVAPAAPAVNDDPCDNCVCPSTGTPSSACAKCC